MTTVLSNPYELVSVQATPAPSGAAGVWHRYEIKQGVNRIVGIRHGGFASVTSAAEAIVIQLNERRIHQRGRVHLVLQSKPPPPQ
jgi:hypothetical protein